jgi:hypothetical protein
MALTRAVWERDERDSEVSSESCRPAPEADKIAPGQLAPSQLLSLQRAAGNRAVARLLSAPAATAPPVRGVRHGTARGLLQRVLEELPGPEKGGQANVKGAGLKELLKETDDGRLYFKSARSTDTEWVLIEVKLSSDGRNYEKTGQERTVKAQKKVPPTVKEWRLLAHISGDKMLYPEQAYPHVTIDLTRAVREPTDRVEFTTMHYSRSYDDPYRSGYTLTTGGWLPVKPNDRKDKQKECDDAVDRFLETVGLPTRVIRA